MKAEEKLQYELAKEKEKMILLEKIDTLSIEEQEIYTSKIIAG